MKRNKFSLLVLLISLVTLISCRDDTVNQQNILGTWISIDKKDTLNFVDNNNFYKNRDHYDYKFYSDSIKIKYNGVLYILVSPTKHKYLLDHNILTIYFGNKSCYGFDLQKMTFIKSR